MPACATTTGMPTWCSLTSTGKIARLSTECDATWLGCEHCYRLDSDASLTTPGVFAPTGDSGVRIAERCHDERRRCPRPSLHFARRPRLQCLSHCPAGVSRTPPEHVIITMSSCPGGGIGRRRGLKIPHPSGFTSSSLVPGIARFQSTVRAPKTESALDVAVALARSAGHAAALGSGAQVPASAARHLNPRPARDTRVKRALPVVSPVQLAL